MMAGKPRKNPVSDEQIIATYREILSAPKTAKALGIGSTTVERVLKAHKVERPGLAHYRENATLFRGQENEIRAVYEAGATYKQLRERFGAASGYAFKQALKRAGATLRDNPAPLPQPSEVEAVREMAAKGMGQATISLVIGRSQSFVSRLALRHGIETNKYPRGPGHPNWKGGRFIDSNGYVRVWIDRDDPMALMADALGYVFEHRLVMARKLGRPLTSKETVHHKDGDTRNNDPDNLQLRQGKHGKHIVLCCLDCGSHNIGPAEIAGP